MKRVRIILSIICCLFLIQTQAQDRLLMTNGKIKKLDGVVVYYDHDDVLYQNENQRKRMKAYVVRKEAKKKSGNDNSAVKEQKEAAKRAAKLAKAKIQLEKRKAVFEEEVKSKMDQLSPADFEKWKIRELDRLKAIEQEQELEAALNEQIANAKINKKAERERAKFTTRVARDLVFSVLKEDSTELVVYNADTLGFFADGDAEIDYGVTDMRAYIKGRQDGRKHKTAFDATIGVAIGAISAGAGAYWGPSIPAGYIIVTSIANTKIKNKAGIDPELLETDAYRDGYERSAKRKKTWSFVKGSVAGLAFGILMWDGIVRGEGLPGPR